MATRPLPEEAERDRTIGADDPANHGWDAAVTLVTPMEHRRRVRWKRTIILGAFGRTWLIEAGHDRGVVPFEPLDDQFKVFNHLHYARWSLADRLPRTSRHQPEETGPFTLLVFTAHFDFGWRRYLGTFIEGLGDSMQHFWGDTPSWRMPRDGFNRFEKFVEDQIVEHGHLFAAYPDWSCNDVRCAVRIRDECLSAGLDQTVVHEHLGVAIDEVTHRRGLVRRLQHCLGHIAPIASAYRSVGAAIPLADPRPHGVTYLVPLPRDQAERVRRLLRDLPYGPESPFAAVPGTHFARLALVDDAYFENRPRVDAFESAYLLLSAEIDADTDAWLRTAFEDEALRDVMSNCWGFEPGADVASFLRPCRLRKLVEYVDYPATTVADIFDASERLEQCYEELGL